MTDDIHHRLLRRILHSEGYVRCEGGHLIVDVHVDIGDFKTEGEACFHDVMNEPLDECPTYGPVGPLDSPPQSLVPGFQYNTETRCIERLVEGVWVPT